MPPWNRFRSGFHDIDLSTLLKPRCMPKVSIIVPNYNYARFLGQRLGSIEGQTYRDFEVILLDDASTDESVQVLERFARQHSCRLVCNDRNSGSPYKQWNKGLTLATGRYVWIAEADDYADVRLLEILVGRLEQNPRCGLAYCNSKRVDATGNVTELVLPTMYDANLDRWRQDFIANGSEECFRFLLRENTIPNASAVVFRRDLYDVVEGVDESLRLCSDWKFWASLLCVSDLAFVAEPLNYFRAHGKSLRSKTGTWARVDEGLQVVKYIVDKLDVPRYALEDLHARMAIIFLHAYITQRPTAVDLARTRELAGSLEFSFSLRAASGFAKQILQAGTERLRGRHREQYRTEIGTANSG
jgi:glycosyltransferase involved in cell wall biosynthesis